MIALSAEDPEVPDPLYAASQAAMRVLLRELKRELSEEGLRTSEVRLGDRQRPSPERCAEAVRYALYHPDIAVVPT